MVHVTQTTLVPFLAKFLLLSYQIPPKLILAMNQTQIHALEKQKLEIELTIKQAELLLKKRSSVK